MSLKQLCTNYSKYLKNPDLPAASLHRELVNVAQTMLVENGPAKYLDDTIKDILITNVKSDKFDAEKVLLAFSYLELYASLLYRYPWKLEYWTIKHHCGFYRTMLDPCLIGADKILEKFGYRTVHGESFQLNVKPDLDCLSEMALQCLFAFSELKIMKKACEAAQSNDYESALLMHLETGGSSKELAEKLRSEENNMFSRSSEANTHNNYSICYSESVSPPAYSSHTTGRALSDHHEYVSIDKYPVTSSYKHLPKNYFSTQLSRNPRIFKNQRPLCLQADSCSDNGYLLHASAQDCFSGASPIYEKSVSSPPYMATNNYAVSSNIATSPYKADSIYRDSSYGSLYDEVSLNLQPNHSCKPRQPMEHSLEKPYADYNGCSKPFERNTPSPQSLVADLTRDYQSKLNFGSSDSLSSENYWHCSICTYKNQVGFTSCQTCGGSQYPNASSGSQYPNASSGSQEMSHKESGERACENCTLKNAVTARKCQLCGQQFKGFQTSV